MKSIKTLLLLINISIVFIVAATIGLTARSQMKTQIKKSLQLYEDTLYESYDTNIKNQMQSVMALLERIYERQTAGEISKKQAQRQAADYVKAIRYGEDNGGYFWIDNMDYILVAHPVLEDQEGENRYELEDQNGVKIIQTIVETVQASKDGGFNEFYYTKADGATVAPKRAYSMLFEPWGWILSTGTYIDDIKQVYEANEKSMNEQLVRQVQINNLCMIGMLLFAIIISIFYARFVTIPLRKIRDFAMRLSKCDFSMPLKIRMNNEFGQTAKTLDDAQEQLKSYIRDVSRMLGEMSNGNFAVRPQVTYTGEFVTIQQSMETIIRSMNQTLHQIHRAAGQVSAGAGHLSDDSQQLAAATVQQASSIGEISQHMERISVQAKKNSDHAEQAKSYAIQTKQHIDQGMEKMAALLNATHDISNASDSIEKIIRNINDIALQTNLLALNASVEASRAGEAGKGFAVVADEVRSLAEKVGHSAEDTQELILNCQTAVKTGTKLAEDMGEALRSIVEKNDAARKLVTEIAADSQKQAENSIYVSKQIRTISQVTQQNAETVQESASSGEALSKQSEMMEQLVRRFRLDKN